MSKMTRSLLVTALLLGVVAIMPTSALANEASQSQELEQEVSVECTAGAYGQNSTCKASGKQKAKQEQTIKFRRGIPEHRPVDTALPAPLTAVGALSAIGSAAGYIAIRRRA